MSAQAQEHGSVKTVLHFSWFVMASAWYPGTVSWMWPYAFGIASLLLAVFVAPLFAFVMPAALSGLGFAALIYGHYGPQTHESDLFMHVMGELMQRGIASLLPAIVLWGAVHLLG